MSEENPDQQVGMAEAGMAEACGCLPWPRAMAATCCGEVEIDRTDDADAERRSNQRCDERHEAHRDRHRS